MSLQMNSTFNEENKNWDVSVAGEIDISSATPFRMELDRVFDEKNANIQIHLNELRYIDSTGLGVIIGAYGRMQEQGFTITLKEPGSSIEKLLRITSLDKIFL